jgi:HEAT repeat protein
MFMREVGMIDRTVGVFAVLVLTAASALSAQIPNDALVQDLQNPSTKTRIKALRQLGDAARADAAAPMAALLLDGNDNVQFEAVSALLKLYTVRDDLTRRAWGIGSIPAKHETPTFPEAAFEAGPLATIPAAVPPEVVVNLSSVMRQDDSGRIRLAAAYALGVLAAPSMGPLAEAAVTAVTNNVVFALSHKDVPTRQVVARVAGRIFAPPPGATAPVMIGDALVASMNDPDPLVRRWAMDSLGWLRYDRAVQALTDHASYYGKGEEGVAALHALARIANPASAPVLRALLANSYIPFRVIAIEGLGRIGDKSVLPQIAESATSAREESVILAEAFARFLLDQPDIVAIADSLEKPSTGIQARVYLAEIALTRPAAIHPLLKTPNPSTRMMAVQVLGASRQPSEVAVLQPLLQDPVPDVVSVTSEAIRRLQASAAGATK